MQLANIASQVEQLAARMARCESRMHVLERSVEELREEARAQAREVERLGAELARRDRAAQRTRVRWWHWRRG
jgi:chromosome segregation ATPase